MRETDAAIELYDPAHRATIQRHEVYFPFASGRLAYDCVSCGSQCCRGHGYLLTVGKELDAQMGSRRGLPVFFERVAATNDRQYRVANCAPGCFFLAPDGQCDIHRRQGYDAKPETCRLFPFNYVRRAGRYLIVAPHAWLCPLTVVAGPPAREESSHDALVRAFSDGGIHARVPACSSRDPVDAVVAHERRIVAMSESFLSTTDMLGFLRAQALADDPVAPLRDVQRSFAEIVAMGARLLDLPDQADLGQAGELSRTAIAVTPFIRAHLVFSGLSDTGRQFEPPEAGRRAHVVLALYLLAECARRAGMRDVTFLTLARLYRDLQALMLCIAHLDRPLQWKRESEVRLPQLGDARHREAFIRLARALLPQEQRGSPTPLGELLLAYAPKDSPARATFVKEVARVLMGEVVPVDDSGQREVGKATLRSTVRQWMLGSLHEPILLAAYDRVNATSLQKR